MIFGTNFTHLEDSGIPPSYTRRATSFPNCASLPMPLASSHPGFQLGEIHRGKTKEVGSLLGFLSEEMRGVKGWS